MGVATIYLLLVAYIIGLLLTGWANVVDLPGGLTVGMIVMAVVGLLSAVIMPRLWRMGPRSLIWIMAGLVGIGAGWYLQWRSPSYDALVQGIAAQQQPSFPQQVQVQGHILNAPRLTRGQRVKFTLSVDQLQILQAGDVTTGDVTTGDVTTGDVTTGEVTTGDVATGENNLAKANGAIAPPTALTRKIYTTIPLLQGTGLYPGDAVKLKGRLYRPQAAAIPGAFDFQQYLARDGIFLGLSGELLQVSHYRPTIHLTDLASWQAIGRSLQQATGHIRQRIIRSFVRGLNSPAGPLLAGMVLGRKAVDLPYEVSDQFIQAGLAHVLAASGFHVSLLLGLMLTLGRSLSASKRFWLGGLTLIGYVSLTGLQPSVCRAALLGLAVLWAAVQERKIRPVGALLMIAAVLLAVNPQWIFDLGFQLSFLATLGLVVTVPWLNQKLDWLPPAIAGAIAVPIAAMVWTLPLLLHTMGTILPYSPLLSVVTTPLIIVLSLGGMVTGAIALFSPTIGSGLASLLYWPMHSLLAMVVGFNQLPGQAIALGTISILQLVSIYSLYGFILWAGSKQTTLPPLHRPVWRWSASLALLTILAIPIWYGRFHTVKITCLTPSQYRHTTPLMVVQNRGRVGLINTGSEADIQYKLLPFLRHQGINRIDWAIATMPLDRSTDRWTQLSHTVPIRQRYPLALPTEDTASTSPADSEVTAFAALTTPVSAIQSAIQTDGLRSSLDLPSPKQLGPHAGLTVASRTPLIIQLTLGDQVWLIMPDGQPQGDENSDLSSEENHNLTIDVATLPPSDIWYWPGLAIASDLEAQLAPHAPRQAIITSIVPPSLPITTLPPVYVVDTQEAIQWQGKTRLVIAPETVNSPDDKL